MNNPDAIQKALAHTLAQLDVNQLPVSEYSRTALKRVLDAAEYYLDIYRNSLERTLAMCDKSPDQMTIVDYGGGHGLLGILAKKLDFARVIYVDYNADALQTVREMSALLGATPDVMLQGNATTLGDWCRNNAVAPDALLAMDVIEHIYVLDEFFATLHSIPTRHSSLKMVFTTASTPFNKRVERRLRRAMQADELGTTTKKGFWQKRRDYVQELGVKNVFFTGHISFAEILAYYRIADVFVCMSEHEGFCVPIVEAMLFKTPIIAFDAGAVADTLGDGGILLKEKDPLLTAGLIDRVARDRELREEILKGQRRQLSRFRFEKIRDLFLRYLSDFCSRKTEEN